VIGFDYIRQLGHFYRPRTSRAALLAVEAGLLPVEAFIYKSLAVKPLFEEPYDIEELERVLARPNLELGDAILLTEIFTAMTRNEDKELALFAAESLGALEGRWVKRVEAARESYRAEETASEEPPSAETAYALAKALSDYALVVGRTKVIRNYYLLEAYYVLAEVAGAGDTPACLELRIRCLLRLGLVAQAERELQEELPRRSDAALLGLAVEAAYLRKDPRRIRELLEDADLEKLEISTVLRELLESWRA